MVQSLRYRKIDFSDTESIRAVVADASGGHAPDAKGEPIAACLALLTGVFPAALKARGLKEA